MRKVLIFGLLFCLVGVQTTFAEDLDLKEEHQFSGKVELGGYKTTGNTDTQTYDGTLELNYAFAKWSSEFSFQGSQTAEGGKVTSDYYEATLRGKYELPYHMYALLQYGYRDDYFGGIIRENSYVVALGYHAFADVPDFSVDIELGYGERISKKVDVVRIDYDPGQHLALFAQYDFSKDDTVKYQFTGEYGNDDDYLKHEISWVHQLFADLHIDFSYETRTSTAPELGIVATDTTLSVKLGYEF